MSALEDRHIEPHTHEVHEVFLPAFPPSPPYLEEPARSVEEGIQSLREFPRSTNHPVEVIAGSYREDGQLHTSLPAEENPVGDLVKRTVSSYDQDSALLRSAPLLDEGSGVSWMASHLQRVVDTFRGQADFQVGLNSPAPTSGGVGIQDDLETSGHHGPPMERSQGADGDPGLRRPER